MQGLSADLRSRKGAGQLLKSTSLLFAEYSYVRHISGIPQPSVSAVVEGRLNTSPTAFRGIPTSDTIPTADIPRSTSLMLNSCVMATSADAACSKHVSRSRSTQAHITTTATGTQCAFTVLISQCSQTMEEFSVLDVDNGQVGVQEKLSVLPWGEVLAAKKKAILRTYSRDPHSCHNGHFPTACEQRETTAVESAGQEEATAVYYHYQRYSAARALKRRVLPSNKSMRNAGTFLRRTVYIQAVCRNPKYTLLEPVVLLVEFCVCIMSPETPPPLSEELGDILNSADMEPCMPDVLFYGLSNAYHEALMQAVADELRLKEKYTPHGLSETIEKQPAHINTSG
ncbi:uncharacterized protein LOC144164311 [Haemaphysalis longicornis]